MAENLGGLPCERGLISETRPSDASYMIPVAHSMTQARGAAENLRRRRIRLGDDGPVGALRSDGVGRPSAAGDNDAQEHRPLQYKLFGSNRVSILSPGQVWNDEDASDGRQLVLPLRLPRQIIGISTENHQLSIRYRRPLNSQMDLAFWIDNALNETYRLTTDDLSGSAPGIGLGVSLTARLR